MKTIGILHNPKVWNVHSAIVETLLPALLNPNFLTVLRSQLTVGPPSIRWLVAIKKEGVSGRGAILLATRIAASSS